MWYSDAKPITFYFFTNQTQTEHSYVVNSGMSHTKINVYVIFQTYYLFSK